MKDKIYKIKNEKKNEQAKGKAVRPRQQTADGRTNLNKTIVLKGQRINRGRRNKRRGQTNECCCKTAEKTTKGASGAVVGGKARKRAKQVKRDRGVRGPFSRTKWCRGARRRAARPDDKERRQNNGRRARGTAGKPTGCPPHSLAAAGAMARRQARQKMDVAKTRARELTLKRARGPLRRRAIERPVNFFCKATCKREQGGDAEATTGAPTP